MTTPVHGSSSIASTPAKSWSPDASSQLYGVQDWGNGYFGVNEAGHVTVGLEDGQEHKQVSIHEIIEGLRDRGTHLPVLLRFRDLLHSRITEINESFLTAMKEIDYRGQYRGVYPIKVNQQRQVIEEIAAFGQKYHSSAFLHGPRRRAAIARSRLLDARCRISSALLQIWPGLKHIPVAAGRKCCKSLPFALHRV